MTDDTHTVEEDVWVDRGTVRVRVAREGDVVPRRRAVALGLVDPHDDTVKQVPDGSADEVLAWVDGDLERARAALTKFEGVDGRKGLVADLRELLDTDTT